MSSVSFIIPVYNKSRFLNLVVDSLKSQKGKFKKSLYLSMMDLQMTRIIN